MPEKAYLLFPLVSAVLYAIGAYVLKSAQQRGVSSAQIAFAANAALAVVFLAIFYPWDHWPSATLWGRAALVGLGLGLGQFATILAFERGAVSIATPMLGTKAVWVALMVAFGLGQPLGWNTWLAVLLTSLGVAALARSSDRGRRGSVWMGLFLALVASVSFAAFDVMVQAWSVDHGFAQIAPLGVGMSVVLALGFPLTRGRRFFTVPRAALVSVTLGIVLLTLQSWLLIWTIAQYQDAAGANVVYGSRGIWSVLLVALLGRWITSVEVMHGWEAFASRLVGAALIAAAIAALLTG